MMALLQRWFAFVAIASLLGACAQMPPAPPGDGPLDPATQPKFVEPLPNPLANVVTPDTRPYPGADYYHLTMAPVRQELGLVDPQTGRRLKTTVWGYGRTPGEASWPGPTLVARSTLPENTRNPGRPVKVRWESELPEAHLLQIDTTVHCGPRRDAPHSHCRPFVRTVVHLHGGHVPDHSDGYPEAWYTPGFKEVGPHWTRAVYDYPNDQEAATLWYHDHAMGITRLNVYAGLAGFYLIRDDDEDRLRADGFLPELAFEVPLLIQDRSFKRDGSLAYGGGPGEHEQRPESVERQGDTSRKRPRDPVTGALVSSVEPEFFGNTIVVNGKIWPVLDVEPRRYRFRLANGSNARFYRLALDSGQAFHQIGSDGGLLPAPVALTQLLLAPAERTDVIVDFADPKLAGKTIVMRNDANAPFPDGDPVDPNTTGQVMAFRVSKPLSPVRDVTLPLALRPPLPTLTAGNTRLLMLAEGEDGFGRVLPLLGTAAGGPLTWDDEITESPTAGATEIWSVANTTEDAHPIHLHLVRFRILDRQPFDTHGFAPGKPESLRFTGPAKPPTADEAGWKDTAIMYPGEVTRVIATFDLPGLYVWHCHILEHEDHEMMRRYRVLPAPGRQESSD